MSWAICPDANLITQAYGCTPILSEWADASCKSGRFHSGIDLGRTDGGWNLYRKPVYATRAGQVVKVGAATLAGYQVDTRVVLYFGDQSVTIRADDGHFTMYGHLDWANCSVGARVKIGDPIGLVGTKGNSTAPHLHVEVRSDGPYQPGPQPTVDPSSYLNPLPNTQEAEMLILDTGTAAKWLLDGGQILDIDSGATLQALQGAGVKTITVTQGFIDTNRRKGTQGAVSGTLTVT